MKPPPFTNHLFAGLAMVLFMVAGCQHPKTEGVVPAASAKWEPQIHALELEDLTNPPPARPIVFVGSSSIRLWKTLTQDFPGLPVINRGFGGSQIADSVAFVERLVLRYQPPLVVMYAGGNDLNAGKTPETVFADFQEFVSKVHRHSPQTSIAYISVAPNPKRWAQLEQIVQLNELVRARCLTDRRLTFINVFSHMLGPDSNPKPDIYLADNLHMNEKGYAIWREVVGAEVLKILRRH